MTPYSNQNGLLASVHERTPLINDDTLSRVSSSSSLSATDIVSVKYATAGDDIPLTTEEDVSEQMSNYSSFQKSFQSMRDHLVKAHSQMSVLIKQHTGERRLLVKNE